MIAIIFLIFFVALSISLFVLKKLKLIRLKNDGYECITIDNFVINALRLLGCTLSIVGVLCFYRLEIVMCILSISIGFIISVVLIGAEYFIVQFNSDKIILCKPFLQKKEVLFCDIQIFKDGGELSIETSDDIVKLSSFPIDLEPLRNAIHNHRPELSAPRKYPYKRRIQDSIYSLKQVCLLVVIYFLLMMALVAVVIQGFNSISTFEKCVILFVGIIPFILIPLSYISATLAHSSDVWERIARAMFKSFALKPGISDVDELKNIMLKHRRIMFLYNGKDCAIFPKGQPEGTPSYAEGIEEFELHCSIGSETDSFEVCGSAEEIINYEFDNGISLATHFESFDFKYLL